MTNLEWAVIYRPDLFSYFDCPECAKSDENEHCTRPEDADFDKRECAKGHVAWLMQPHESASEDEGGPVSVSDECEPAKEESGPQNGADSRERLESDCNKLILKIQKRTFSGRDATALRCQLHDLLDRQAAITEREVKLRELYRFEENHREYIDSIEEVNRRLNERIKELESELADIKEPVKDEKAPESDADSREKLELDIRGSLGFTTKDVFEWLDRQAAITRAELEDEVTLLEHDRDYWNARAQHFEEIIGKLNMQSRAENVPEAPEHVCYTCKWYAGVSSSIGDCHLWPFGVEKAPDDWCGEWSA